MKKLKLLSAVAVILVLAVIAWLVWYMPAGTGKVGMDAAKATANGVVQDNSGKTVLFWYDPMVPTQKFDKPGKSPFMDMMLEPKYAEADGSDRGVVIPSQTVQNLGMRIARVEMGTFGDKLMAVGRIEPDERRFYTLQPRIQGFVERLMVRAVGDQVRKGQKVAEIYSPELLAAEQEYLALLDYENSAVTHGLAQGARGRLKLLGMTEGEIADITRNRVATQRFGIYAPASGVLTELGVREGGQLMAGAALMQITDLSSVWLIAEVPERDAAKLNVGTPAEVELQSRPGEVFKGKVNYLYPALDETSRTVRVRIELANKGDHLRIGMYGNAMLAGAARQSLSVPSESVIFTGTRKIVIIRQDDGFKPVEVETGQERDGRTEILKGLSKGDEVVASGQFLIDSEASLSGVLTRLSQQANGAQDMDSMTAGQKAAEKMTQKMPKGQGKVVAVDIKSGEITLAHEPIAELGWPAMTMGFKVKDAGQLDKLKPNDRVQFELKAQGDEYLIDHIEKQGEMQ